MGFLYICMYIIVYIYIYMHIEQKIGAVQIILFLSFSSSVLTSSFLTIPFFFLSFFFPFPFCYRAARWHTPLSRPFNLGKSCTNEGTTGRNVQNCRKHTGGPKKKQWKMEQRKPQAKVKHRWNFPQDRHTVWQVKRGR